MTTRSAIDSFLSERRIAMVGVSRNPKHFSRALWKAFRERGFVVAPVHPVAPQIDGVAAVANISEAAAVAALIVTPPAEAAKVVEECAAAGVKKVWLYRAVGTGCATPEAISAARKAGMETVEGECPMMWLEKTEWFHGVHKTLRGVFGQLPR
ncbi:MAG: CoA-binding protein [Bryobacter sp.]|jgi:hypothetical protein|nr:CoA-binding protein [Bryobacter sp.]